MFGKSKKVNADGLIEEFMSPGVSYETKGTMLSMMLRLAQEKKLKFSDSQKLNLANYALAEARDIIILLQSATEYKKITDAIGYCEALFPAIGNWHNDRSEFEPILRALAAEIQKNMILERKIEEFFGNSDCSEAAAKDLIATVLNIKDESHKCILMLGLEKHKHELGNLSQGVKTIFREYILGEINRYLALQERNDTIVDNLEYLADNAGAFMDDEMEAALHKLIDLDIGVINFYVLMSLVNNGREVDDNFIRSLAENETYANGAYSFLKTKGMVQRFPTQYTDQVYLAKSDMIHWLIYPTELGKEPDRIEYVGAVKASGDDYYIFRFMSNSDTLSDEKKNKWLLGWSSEDGVTFSDFDEYSEFDRGSIEKTLKCIKKKVL